MNREEAIQLAVDLIQDSPQSRLVNLSAVSAEFVDGEETLRELRAESPPEMDLNFEYPDYWMVTFPLLEPDDLRGDDLAVKVECLSKKVRLMEE